MRVEIDSRVPKGWQKPTAHRVARGVEFLVCSGIPFVYITKRPDFCMMDNRRDVLCDSCPRDGLGIRLALGRHGRVAKGFYPAYPLMLKQWDLLLSKLWRTAAEFVDSRPELCAR